MYEFGGYGEAEAETESGQEVEALLLSEGLRVSYLSEGRDGALCPVWLETV